MTALLLAPHCDDEALFASFLILKHRPRVIVCTQPKVQEQWGVYATERIDETTEALKILGVDEWTLLEFLDTDVDAELYAGLTKWLAEGVKSDELGLPGVVLAPSYEQGGHPQHNAVALAAIDVFGANVVHYLTYTRSGGRSTGGTEVELDDPEWISLKLQALACYRSQMRVPNCRPWFYEMLDVREWTA